MMSPKINTRVGVALALTALSLPSRAQTYTVTILHPLSGFSESSSLGTSRNAQVGFGRSTSGDTSNHALLWRGDVASVVDLNPLGFVRSYARGTTDTTQVGEALTGQVLTLGNLEFPVFHAFLWQGTAASAVDLHPANFALSTAQAVSGNTQVGYGQFPAGEPQPSFVVSHALLWSGTAASAVDLNPVGFRESYGLGVSGNTQVGYGFGLATGGKIHALLWRGSASSALDLNPIGFVSSIATGSSGSAQIGYGSGLATDSYDHALLWSGSAVSAMDLHPVGFTSSRATGVSGSVQVGYGYESLPSISHALLWSGTAASAVDLHNTLSGLSYNGSPVTFTKSQASGVFGNAVVGTASTSAGQTYAVRWLVLPTITSVSPTSTLQNLPTTVTVTGGGFLPDDTVSLGGTALTTTWISSTQLSASVPAGTAGTFPLSIQRSAGASNAINFRVYRPATAVCTGATYAATLPGAAVTATLHNTGEVSAKNLTGVTGKLYNSRGALVGTLTSSPSNASIAPGGAIMVTYSLPSPLSPGTYTLVPTGSFTQSGFRAGGTLTGSATFTR
jgi:IPT/TIG domain